MTTTEAFALYLGLNMLILLFLAVRVVRQRIKDEATIGDGGGANETLLYKVRTHGNAAENFPIIFIGLWALLGFGLSVLWVHVIGGVYTIGRIMHAIGMGGGPIIFRQLGILSSWVLMLIMGGLLIYHAVG